MDRAKTVLQDLSIVPATIAGIWVVEWVPYFVSSAFLQTPEKEGVIVETLFAYLFFGAVISSLCIFFLVGLVTIIGSSQEAGAWIAGLSSLAYFIYVFMTGGKVPRFEPSRDYSLHNPCDTILLYPLRGCQPWQRK